MKTFRKSRPRLGRDDGGSASIEAALLFPVFLTLTVGVVDLGTLVFEAMQMNATAQAGAAAAVMDPSLSTVNAAMTHAAGGFTLDAAHTTWAIANGVVTISAGCGTGVGGSCAPLIPWHLGGTYIAHPFASGLSATVTVRVK